MRALELLRVTPFLLTVSLVRKRFGPPVGGWIAGRPVVAGPLLGSIAPQRGSALAATAAGAFATVCFGRVGTRGCASRGWPFPRVVAVAAWGCAAGLRHPLPLTPLRGAVIAAASRLFARPATGAAHFRPIVMQAAR